MIGGLKIPTSATSAMASLAFRLENFQTTAAKLASDGQGGGIPSRQERRQNARSAAKAARSERKAHAMKTGAPGGAAAVH